VCSLGIVTYLPSPNYYDMSINKLYEYMAAYMPIIASDIPQWREKLEHLGCCYFVDPSDPEAIADAIEYLLDNPEVTKEMGIKGREAVMQHFNWGVSEKVLLNTYERVLKG
jgi:glycosyltransferase involved in cell wall biosynthesis